MTSIEILEFKRAIRQRDGNRCVHCGMDDAEHRRRHGHRLHVHRKTRGAEYTADDCGTLCRECHAEEHRKDPPRPGRRRKRSRRANSLSFKVGTAVYERAVVRAAELGLSLSAYVRRVIGRDLEEAGRE